MSGFTPQQIAALVAKLDGSVVKKRQQAGRNFSYIEGWHAIAEANRIFGFDAWDRETVEMRQLGEPREVDGKWRVAYMARVRIKVVAAEHSIVREGTGYGSGIDRDLGSAHESAIKEAETDAMKRALMTFGNPFGLALYDKDQENVEHSPPAHKPAPAATPARAVADPKAQAEAIAQRIKAAPNLFALNQTMEDARDTMVTFPPVTQKFLTDLYNKRRVAMEEAA